MFTNYSLGKMLNASFEHIFQWLEINKIIQLKHGKAFNDLHKEQYDIFSDGREAHKQSDIVLPLSIIWGTIDVIFTQDKATICKQ